jgi:recA bacterial DNA recombination protein
MPTPFPLGWRIDPQPETLGLAQCPRGRITEIIGTLSSGRTSLLHSILADATRQGEFAVLIDCTDNFDPCSASAAGADLPKIHWIRCARNVDHAMRAADLVLHSGGFGVIALDLAEAPDRALQRIPATTWFRWRRAIESTKTILAVIAQRPLAKSCSALIIEMNRRHADFNGNLLRAAEFEIVPRKPIGRERTALHVCLHPCA